MIGNNFAGVIAFMKVASLRSVSAAARELGVTAPAISKSISRLEAQLGLKLLDRNTHKVNLTHEGHYLYDTGSNSVNHVLQVFTELVGASASSSGCVRIQSTVGFGRKCIAPLLPVFYERHPDISLELELSDRSTDYFKEGIDITVCGGSITHRNIVARKLAPLRMLVCTSPAFLKRKGTPDSINDLLALDTVGFRDAATGKVSAWEFFINGAVKRIDMSEKLVFNDPDLMTAAILSGAGIAQLADYHVKSYIASGELVTLMDNFTLVGEGHYLCYQGGKKMPARTRAVIDYLLECFGVNNL